MKTPVCTSRSFTIARATTSSGSRRATSGPGRHPGDLLIGLKCYKAAACVTKRAPSRWRRRVDRRTVISASAAPAMVDETRVFLSVELVYFNGRSPGRYACRLRGRLSSYCLVLMWSHQLLKLCVGIRQELDGVSLSGWSSLLCNMWISSVQNIASIVLIQFCNVLCLS